MPESFRCSDAARERQDPLVGTAPPQPRLILVEQDGGWAADGFASLPIPEDVRAEVQARAEAAGARLMLIRRPGRQSSAVCLMRAWCVVDPGAPAGHRVTWGTWAYPAELLAAVDRAAELAAWSRTRAGDGTAPAPGPAGDDETLLLVCTHSKKDVCCAVRGRPVAAELAAAYPEQTWECSHTGGDRFAANLLVLPDGASYGGLDPQAAGDVVRGHLSGRPGAHHLRGVLGHPRVVQAALVAAVREGLPWGAVRPVDVRQVEPGTDVARWEVDLGGPDGSGMRVHVTEHDRPPARLTCKAVDPAPSRVPVVTSVTPLPV